MILNTIVWTEPAYQSCLCRGSLLCTVIELVVAEDNDCRTFRSVTSSITFSYTKVVLIKFLTNNATLQLFPSYHTSSGVLLYTLDTWKMFGVQNSLTINFVKSFAQHHNMHHTQQWSHCAYTTE